MAPRSSDPASVPPVDVKGMSGAIQDVFSKCQDADVPMSKSVSKFNKILNKVVRDCGGEEDGRGLDIFFDKFVFFLQLPLASKTRTPFVDRCLEVVCRFASHSYTEKQKELQASRREAAEQNGGEGEAESEDDLDLPPILHKLFSWLLDNHEVEASQARLRICLLINALLKLMGEDASIDDELYQKIFDNMLERLKDKNEEIRSQAVTALQRLQDPRDENCPIIKAFLFHLSCDPSALVRRTVVRCIGATRLTLPHITKRTKDSDESVRKAAFKFIADKIHIKSLTIGQREQILQRGLADRADGVRSIVERDLVPSWLRVSNDKIVELLYALDVGNSDGKIAADMLAVLFKNLPYKDLVQNFQYIDDNNLVPFDKLTPETAVYWSSLAKFLFSESGGAHDFLEKLLPELSRFCTYVRHYVIELERPSPKTSAMDHSHAGEGAADDEDETTWAFIAKQLIEMTLVFDFTDEVGRVNLGNLCKDLMANKRVPAAFVEPLMEIFAKIRTDSESRIQEVAEIISELRDPLRSDEEMMAAPVSEAATPAGPTKAEMAKMEAANKSKKVAIAKIRVKLTELKDEIDEAIQNKDFVRAQQVKLEMEQLEEEQTKIEDELTEALAMASRPVSAEKQKAKKKRASTDGESEEAPESNKKEDPVVIHKCLEMIYQLLQDLSIKTLNPTLRTFFTELVLPSIQSLEAAVRKSAVVALGMCCLRDIELARENLLLLFQVCHLDQSDVRVKALSMVNDLLMFHGLTAFMTTNGADRGAAAIDGENSIIASMLDLELSDVSGNRQGHGLTQDELNSNGGNSVVVILTRLLDDPDLDVRTKVVENMCKLLMTGAIVSAKLLQRLFLTWYNPVTEEDGRMRHILGTFFPLYASMRRSNQDSLEMALLPTLKTLINAPPTSPLAEVDIEDVGLFIIQLTREDFLQVRDSAAVTNVHDSLAFTLANEIISEPDSIHTKSLIKLLNNLTLTSNDYVKLREIKKLYDQMKGRVKEKMCVKNLDKFGERISDWLKNDPGAAEVEADPAGEDNMEAEGEAPAAAAEEACTTAAEESGLNKTKMRRVLYSHPNETAMLSPTGDVSRADSEVIDTAITSSEAASSGGVFLTPDARPAAPQKKVPRMELEVTRVDETSDEEGSSEPSPKKIPRVEITRVQETSDEEESEELFSGNLSRQRKKGLAMEQRATRSRKAPAAASTGESSEELFPKSDNSVKKKRQKKSSAEESSEEMFPRSDNSVKKKQPKKSPANPKAPPVERRRSSRLSK